MQQIKPIRLAFGHKARVGKDTAVSYISTTYGCKVVRFAEPIYKLGTEIQKICLAFFILPLGMIISKLSSIIDKLVLIKYKPDRQVSDKVFDWINKVLLPRILQEGGCGAPGTKTPWLLQMIGTDLRNLIDKNLWVNTVVEQINNYREENPSVNICCPDMRFHNEFVALGKLGFKRIKINRKDRKIDRDPNHPSEIALDNHTYDYVIDNDGTISEYLDNLKKMMEVLKDS